jgi:FlaA1/EpsC-like NDP-sugar epimerase
LDLVRKLVGLATEVGTGTGTVPLMEDVISGRVQVNALRPTEIHDLLGREPVTTDLQAVKKLVTGETVLVTGAGGSIGSELCRQLSQFGPRRIVLLGHGENPIFEIDQELQGRFPKIDFIPVIADIRDRDRLTRIHRMFDPGVVFHSAAHKHVPMMEHNVAEAITNNVAGTRNVVEVAAMSGVGHLVCLSTDKAIRPTSIMGATKRVAEQIVQHVAQEQKKDFVAVRFGNVLGSRGSVLPIFLRQIAEGGPVAVTHPEMRRYFMTIPEAVELVLQAGALGCGGEVFVLDMGEQVKIADLAADLIRLSGKEVGTDIQICYTGIRPGEKLYEEIFLTAENVAPTQHPKILRARNAELPGGVAAGINELIVAALSGRSDEEMCVLLRRLVPDFTPFEAEMRQAV